MAVVSPPQVELREARFQDYPEIARLEAANGLQSKPYDEWRRLWSGNPYYEKLGLGWPIGWVLEDRERVVGCLCNVPLPYVFRGVDLLIATGRGWAVDPAYRSYALLLMDEYFNQPSVDVFLNNTVNGEAAEAFTTFGSKRVPAGDWSKAAFMVTEPRGFAESALRIKQVPQAKLLSYPAGLGLALKERFTRKPFPKSDIKVTLAGDFDERFDTFWEILKNRSEHFLAVRSREMLRWHFASYIEKGKLWVLTAARAGNIDAYAVFQRRNEPKYGLTRMRMVDFQACDWHDQYCAALMSRAFDECLAQGIQVLEHVGCDLERTRIFDGRAPYRRNLPGWCYYYSARDESVATELDLAESWDPSSYDGDASL